MIGCLDQIFQNAESMEINEGSRIVIMSDCHRGSGDNHDNFLKNRNIFLTALEYYYERGFTYIELGDGDEMWEVDDYSKIIEEHMSAFQLLKKFHDEGRFLMIYGNHDNLKRNAEVLRQVFYSYQKNVLFGDLKVREAFILKYKNYDIFLIHGHQVDLLNSSFSLLSQFLVRYIWKNLELIGVMAPTIAARNYPVSNRVEKRLEKWSQRNNRILISGHTHRPIFPKAGESLYFNDGSCIHPNGITCIEIENGKICLVKWVLLVSHNKVIGMRVPLEKPEEIDAFFSE